MRKRPPAPSATPRGGRAAKAAIRREQLLSTALALFSEHGYAATSTRRIADAAGITEGLVFHYFESKEALLLELMSRQSTFAGRVLSLLQRASSGTARELFAAIASGYADVSEEESMLVGLITAESHVNVALRARIAAADAFVHEGFRRVLHARVEDGELRSDASLEVAILGFTGGFAAFHAQHRDVGRAVWRREAAAFAEAWADQCWRGIASPAALQRLSDHSTKARPRRPKGSRDDADS